MVWRCITFYFFTWRYQELAVELTSLSHICIHALHPGTGKHWSCIRPKPWVPFSAGISLGKRKRAGQAWSDGSSGCSSVDQGLKLAPKSLWKTPCLGKDWGGRGRNGAFSRSCSGDVCCCSWNLAGAGARTCLSNCSRSAWIAKILFFVLQRLLLKLC